MPLYEFKCDKCSTIQEKLARHDCESVSCSEQDCDGACAKIFSRAGIVFEKKFYPNGKDWNETRREKWENPKTWQHDYEKRIHDGK